MEESVKQRVMKILQEKRFSQKRFESFVGLSNGAVDKLGDNPRADTLQKIIRAFPDINARWLLMGDKDMHEIEEDKATIANLNAYVADLRGQIAELKAQLGNKKVAVN